jgi:hypothetical protein
MALALDARTGLPPTMTKIGLECDEPRIRTAIQLLALIGTLKLTACTEPSAITVRRADIYDHFERDISGIPDPRSFDVPVGLLIQWAILNVRGWHRVISVCGETLSVPVQTRVGLPGFLAQKMLGPHHIVRGDRGRFEIRRNPYRHVDVTGSWQLYFA